MARLVFSIHTPPHEAWQFSSFSLHHPSTPQLYKFHVQQLSVPTDTVGALVVGDNTGAFVGELVGSLVGDDVVGLDVTGDCVGLGVGAPVRHAEHPLHLFHLHFFVQSALAPSHQLLQGNG